MRDVQPGQVHQLERPELEAHLVTQDAVGCGEIADAFADQAQCFGAITPTRVVDDEARCVRRAHRHMAHLPGVGGQGGTGGFIGADAGNDFHHLHQRYRVEEMQAGEPLRALQCGGDGRNR